MLQRVRFGVKGLGSRVLGTWVYFSAGSRRIEQWFLDFPGVYEIFSRFSCKSFGST